MILRYGIITYHFANNYGAMLQCYALKTAIQNLGHDAIVINYISDKQLDNNAVYRKRQGVKGIIKNLLLIPFNKGRKKRLLSFNNFRKEYLECTGYRINNKSTLENYIENGGFDAIISGSDQVWNPNVFDFDDAFFFPFYVPVRKIGYAVSLGTASESQLRTYKKWIDDFDVITVREPKSALIINQVTSKTITSVVDPVLLLPQSSWKELVPCHKTNKLLCYFVREEGLQGKIQRAKELAYQLNLEVEIVNLRITKQNFSEKILFDLSPIDFLTELSNAEYVYTDSFHGTVFSLIYERNFTTVVSNSESGDNRKRDILNMVGLTNRIRNIDVSSDVLESIDYKLVNKKMMVIRNRSNALLNDFLTDSTNGETL